jgi:hypothetical protein
MCPHEEITLGRNRWHGCREAMIASPGFLQLTTADSRRGVCAKDSPGVDPHEHISPFGES